MRGKTWFELLSSSLDEYKASVPSVRVAEGELQGIPVSIVAVVPDADNLFPRARRGEVGLLEGWALSRVIEDIVTHDEGKPRKRLIICVVDVVSQAYGRREEAYGIHQALAAAVESYVRARLVGHPIISLLVGKAMSGAFLAHGYQANRIIALRDKEVMVHAMSKASAARVTLRTVEQLESLAEQIPPMSYSIDGFATLGLLRESCEIENPNYPSQKDLEKILNAIVAAYWDIEESESKGLEQRLMGYNRIASCQVRKRMAEQW